MPVEFRRVAAAVRVNGRLVPIEAGEPMLPPPVPPAQVPEEPAQPG